MTPTLIAELQAAHQIIRNALNIMNPRQKAKWGEVNAKAGIDGEGITRANEREAAIQAALAAQHNQI